MVETNKWHVRSNGLNSIIMDQDCNVIAECPSEEGAKRIVKMRQAIQDFTHNVGHQNVAGWGDICENVKVDQSFRELKAALEPDARLNANRPDRHG